MYLPVMLDLEGRKIVLIGGGHIALQKAEKLIEFGASLTIVSLTFLDIFYRMPGVELKHEAYREEHLEGAFFVIVATNDRALNQEIYKTCSQRHVLCNVVDDAPLCDFIFSAALKRGDLILSASTGGKSPNLAKKIIRDLSDFYDESYEEKVDLLGMIRTGLSRSGIDVVSRRAILKEIVEWDNEALKRYLDTMKGGGDR